MSTHATISLKPRAAATPEAAVEDVVEAVAIAVSGVTVVATVATVEASSVVAVVDEAVVVTVVATPSEAASADEADQLDPAPHASRTPRRSQLWEHRHVYLLHGIPRELALALYANGLGQNKKARLVWLAVYYGNGSLSREGLFCGICYLGHLVFSRYSCTVGI